MRAGIEEVHTVSRKQVGRVQALTIGGKYLGGHPSRVKALHATLQVFPDGVKVAVFRTLFDEPWKNVQALDVVGADDVAPLLEAPPFQEAGPLALSWKKDKAPTFVLVKGTFGEFIFQTKTKTVEALRNDLAPWIAWLNGEALADTDGTKHIQPPAIVEDEFKRLKKRVQKALSQNLGQDESIKAIIRGAFGQAMVGTDSRVFVCKPGFMAGATFGSEVTSWSYLNIIGVQRHKGPMSGAVALQAAGQSGKKMSYWGHHDDDPMKAPNAIPVAGDWPLVDAGVARLRELIDQAHKRVEVDEAAMGKPRLLADELRKLSELQREGFLTAEEFVLAKSTLIKGRDGQ